MEQEKKQELIFRLGIFEQQIHQLQEQADAVEKGIIDLGALNFGLDELKGSIGKEILSPLGKGIFVKRNLLISSPALSLSGYGAHSRDIIESLWNSDKFNISCIINGWAASSSIEGLSVNMRDILEFCVKNKFH